MPPSGPKPTVPPPSPLLRRRLSWPSPAPLVPQYPRKVPSTVYSAKRSEYGSEPHRRPPRSRTRAFGSRRSGGLAKRAARTATGGNGVGVADAMAVDGLTDEAGGGADAADASGVGLMATMGAGVRPAPSPPIAYTVPRSVPRKTSP